MGRSFRGTNSSNITIANWWPDEIAFHDYREVGLRVVLTHDSDNSNTLVVRGGPLTQNQLGNTNYHFGAALNYISDNIFGNPAPISEIWSYGRTQTVGGYSSSSGGVAIARGVQATYAGAAYKGSPGGSYTFYGNGSASPGIGSSVQGVGGSTITSEGSPWYFFNDSGTGGFINNVFWGAKDLLIDCHWGNFYGDLESIETWIVRGDGTTWSRTRTFTGGSEDTIEPFDPVILTEDSYSYFDTRRKLYAPIHIIYEPESAYTYFDTRRKLSYKPELIGTPPIYQGFDTRRKLSKLIGTTALFDARRRVCKKLTSYHDTRRRFILGTIRIPLDTLR